jgi:predicted acylesterase/phospholipase RssA/CRP-like cAMP-binding protein
MSTLRHSPLADVLRDDELIRVARAVTLRQVPVGEQICRAGHRADHSYFLVSGQVKVTIPAGRHPERLFAVLGPGDNFGSIALLNDNPYPVNVSAVEDCVLLQLGKQNFHRLYNEKPSLGRSLIRILGFHFRESLMVDGHRRAARVIAMIAANGRSPALLPLLLRKLRAHDRTAVLRIDGAPYAANCSPEANCFRAEELRTQIHETLQSHDRVILDLSIADAHTGLRQALAVAEQLLWLVEPGSHEETLRRMTELLHSDVDAERRSDVVWVLREDQQVAPRLGEAWRLAERGLKVQLAADPERPTRLQRQGIARLVRHIRGIRLGLALGGGAARGMAHLGVLRAFDRAEIGFDVIAGTSSGAMIGIPYAAGYTPERAIDEFTRDLRPPWFYRIMPGGRQWYLLSKYRGRGWDKMLRPYLFDWTLQQLQVPMHTLAVDLVTGSQVIRSRGDAVEALLESINLPMVSTPICRDGMALVDGGVLNTLPTQTLVDRGADLIVGVSVSGTIRQEFAGNRPGMTSGRMKRPSTLQTFLRVLETQDHALKTIDSRSADVLIEPDTTSFDLADFTRTPQLADVGDAAAEQAIPRLREMIRDIEDNALQHASYREPMAHSVP